MRRGRQQRGEPRAAHAGGWRRRGGGPARGRPCLRPGQGRRRAQRRSAGSRGVPRDRILAPAVTCGASRRCGGPCKDDSLAAQCPSEHLPGRWRSERWPASSVALLLVSGGFGGRWQWLTESGGAWPTQSNCWSWVGQPLSSARGRVGRGRAPFGEVANPSLVAGRYESDIVIPEARYCSP